MKASQVEADLRQMDASVIGLGICVEIVYNIMLPLMTLTFILLNILLYVLIVVISTCYF